VSAHPIEAGPRPAVLVLIGCGHDAVHLVDETQRGGKTALCGAFCSFTFRAVIMPTDTVCPRCLGLRGDIGLAGARQNGRLF
jgi:hypothetical protein